ncbi:MDR family MFS transporter [Clostridium sp.]|jgi:EmrB/QacA subfamily drug resistance transporter|uniref:MDR family MFS transporter n=1 Tax=Clostridium sp. TaxID=1506 RepID=UPI00258C1A64|nr:MDR family MFS transporter [Clostridium sp.]MDF2502812.1 arabinose efflux permease family protein [Clostridium sp.]
MNTKKSNIVVAIMVAMFLGAVEGTVVTTAMPTIVKQLNGFSEISLVFSLYLLTSAISTPIYGKLADLYGRKNTLSIGIIIFLIGSSLCGLSQNMYQFIAFRGIQGIGAGAIFTITYTIVGDVFSLPERARIQGWLSTVWGIASIAGPFLGGFLIQYLSWHWIFYVNIPFGIVSIILLQKNLEETFEKNNNPIDFVGIVTLSFSIVLFLYGVLSIQHNKKLYSTSLVVSLIFTAIFLIIFYKVERKAKEPIIPFEIFTKSNIIANLVSLLASAILIALDVYMPLYIQSVLGYSAAISGVAMAPVSISWLLSSVILSKAISKYGKNSVVCISSIILLLSCLLLGTLYLRTSLVLVIFYTFIMGFGFGGAFTTLTIIVQESVYYNKRGAATASNSLLRTIGQTVGVSIFGIVFNLNIVRYFYKLGRKNVDPNSLYSADVINTGIPISVMKDALNYGMHVVFIVLIIISIVSLILSFMLKNIKDNAIKG